MRLLKFGAILVLLVVGITTGASAALANEPDYSNPAVMLGLLQQLSPSNPNASATFAGLSLNAKVALMAVVRRSKLVRETDTGTSNIPGEAADTDTAATYCPSGSSLAKFKNRFSYYDPITNYVQWRITQVAKWCYNGSSITRVRIPLKRTLEINLIGWQFGGYFGDYQDGGVGDSYYEDYFQATLQFCVLGCVAEVDPWLDAYLEGNGYFDASAGS